MTPTKLEELAELAERSALAAVTAAFAHGAEHGRTGSNTSATAERADKAYRQLVQDLRALAGDGWRPIESAPMDVPILLYKDGRQHVGQWAQNQDTGTIGWILAELGGGNRAILERATHWRSLPPPPAKENDSHE